MKRKPKNLQSKKEDILESWIKYQMQDESLRDDLMSNKELENESRELLDDFLEVLQNSMPQNFNDEKYDKIKQTLTEISVSRANKGYSPKETGTYILSIKEAFSSALKEEYKKDVEGFYDQIMKINQVVDKMSLYAFENYLKSREQVILRQRDEISEISTPVIKIWEEILAIPIIGTLDSSRTQIIMESLLTEIVKTGSSIAILDISGVPTVDSLVAQHLIKTVSATRLMGAECVISGIRPEIAQTMIHLGINLSDITTKSTMASALKHAFTIQRLNQTKEKSRR